MFRKKAQSISNALLGEKSIITGRFDSGGSIDVCGMFDGELSAKKNIVISKMAMVKGKISADNVYIYGKVEADISAARKVTIASGGSLTGNIKCRHIRIARDGEYKGNCLIVSK